MPPRSLASIVALTTFVSPSLFAAPGARAGTFDRDTTWAHTGLAASPPDGSARWSALAMLADGRFLAAGPHPRRPGGRRALHRRGELDTTWAADQPTPGLLVVSAQAGVTPAALIVLRRRQVLLGATTLANDFTPSLVVARLTADGHLDPTFATAGKIVTTSGPETEMGNLAVTPDGTSSSPPPPRGSGDRPRPGRAPDRRRRARHHVRHGRRGRLPPRRRRHDVLRPRARRRGSHLPRRQPGDARRATRWSSRALTAAGVLDPTYGAGSAGYAVANLNGAAAAIYEVDARAPARRRERHRARRLHRQERDRPADRT